MLHIISLSFFFLFSSFIFLRINPIKMPLKYVINVEINNNIAYLGVRAHIKVVTGYQQPYISLFFKEKVKHTNSTIEKNHKMI